MTSLQWLVSIVVLVVLALILFPFFAYSGGHPVHDACLSRVKQLGLAFLMYDQDAGSLPTSIKWMDRLGPYAKNPLIFHCPFPSEPDSDKYGYAMRKKFSQVPLDSLKNPSSEALVFDSNLLSRNANTDSVYVPNFSRHLRQNIGYADGHAKAGKFIGVRSQ